MHVTDERKQSYLVLLLLGSPQRKKILSFVWMGLCSSFVWNADGAWSKEFHLGTFKELGDEIKGNRQCDWLFPLKGTCSLPETACN